VAIYTPIARNKDLRENTQFINRLSLSGPLIKDSEDFQRVRAQLLKTQPSFEEFYRGEKLYREGKKSLGKGALYQGYKPLGQELHGYGLFNLS